MCNETRGVPSFKNSLNFQLPIYEQFIVSSFHLIVTFTVTFCLLSYFEYCLFEPF